MNDFANWLNEQMERKGWSQNELARRAGVSQAQVSNVLGGYKAGEDFLVGIAKALGITKRQVFAAACIIEPEPDENEPTIQSALNEFMRLSTDEQIHILTTMRALNAYKTTRTNNQPG